MYLKISKGDSDGQPKESPVRHKFFFFFSLLAKFDVKRSLGFFSPTLSLYRSIARVFLERENVKKTLM